MTIPVAAGTPADCAVPGWDDRCEKWAHRYTEGESPPSGRVTHDFAVSGELNRTGTRAFAVGHRVDWPRTVKNEMQTVAYDVVTGETLWAAHEAGPTEDWHATSQGVAVSRDDKIVYAVGTLRLDSPPKGDVVVAAYDPATGARLWRHVYDGPARGYDEGISVAVSPSDDRVFVAASVQASDLPTLGGSVDSDFALLTLAGRTGELIEATTYGGPTFTVDGKLYASVDHPRQIHVSPDGQTTAIAGFTAGRETFREARQHATVVLWNRSSEEDPGWQRVWARELPGVSLGLGLLGDGGVAFAGAAAEPVSSTRPYSILGLDASDGSTAWETRFELGGLSHHVEAPTGLLLDQVRDRIYLPGISRFPSNSHGMLGALALSASDGSVVWTARLRDFRSETTRIFDYDADEMATAAVDPASGHLQLASLREGKVSTYSLDHRTGARRWIGWYEHPMREKSPLESGTDWPLAIRAAAGRVVVFGGSYLTSGDTCFTNGLPHPCSRYDVLTIAYEV